MFLRRGCPSGGTLQIITRAEWQECAALAARVAYQLTGLVIVMATAVARLRAMKPRVRLDPSLVFSGKPNTTALRPARKIYLSVASLLMSIISPRVAFAQLNSAPLRLPSGGGEASLEADQQHQSGKISYADGNVDIHYENARLRADHVQYDGETQAVTATGHVRLDYLTQHVEASDAYYELRTGRGKFHHVRATFSVQRRPTPTLLISPNPLYFEAEEADRLDQTTYQIRKAWLTVCDPGKPVWKFYAPNAKVQLRESVHIENGNFRLLSIPVLYLPYATFPAEKARDSGFMIPLPGDSSTKGFVLGDAVYWAPTDWMDLTIGGAYYSRRGWSQNGELRMRPWENANLEATYFGVMDRGLEQPGGAPPLRQGGHEARLLFTALLPGSMARGRGPRSAHIAHVSSGLLGNFHAGD